MKASKITLLALMSAFALSLLTVGCARTVSQTETTKVRSNGTVERRERTVTESPDGTVTRTEKRTTNP